MIYLDHAATTPPTKAALRAAEIGLQVWGNPSSHYDIGFTARRMIDGARKEIAESINCEPEEIYFTSGGSEGDNWIIRKTWNPPLPVKKPVVSAFEHPAILNAAIARGNYLSVPVERSGIVDPDVLDDILDRHKSEPYGLVSIMTVNNEIGTIQPIKELAQVAHKHGLLFHTDAVQAVGHVPLDVKELGVDMLTVSGHKFGCPKGIGFNYVRKGMTALKSFIAGGHQENNMRAGTENTAYIAAIAVAFAEANKCKNVDAVRQMRADLWDSMLIRIPNIDLNGSQRQRIDSNINVCIHGIDAQTLVALLDSQGICVSTGSACSSGIPLPSHVLKAIGLSDEDANSSIRITLGPENTMDELDFFVKYLQQDVEALRED